MDENDELFDEEEEFEDPEFDEPEMPRPEEDDGLPPLVVWVNAGFGKRSYPCRINRDSTMTLPDPLVRELDMHPGDDLDMEFDEEDGTLYVAKKTPKWEAPDWLTD
jgi:hypothetical protein